MSVKADSVAERLERADVRFELRTLGERELPVALPGDEAGVARTLELAGAERWRAVPTGLSSKLGWCRPEVLAGEADLLISTRELDEIVAYVPGDGTLTAQAGCRMLALGEHVAREGHRLTPDVPRPGDATLGGTLAAGISGPDRLLHGPSRHHVLGMRVALVDGTLARSGGRLVKNVTGFDLHRLFTGSRGTLCVVLEASLRLFPRPAGERVWHARARTTAGALDAVNALAELPPLAPRWMALARESGGAGWELALCAGGSERQLDVAREQVEGVLGSSEATELDGDAARDASARWRDLSLPPHGAPALVATCLPSRLGDVLATLEERGGRLVVQPRVASVELFLDGPSGANGAADLVELARELAAQGADVEARNAPRAVHEALAPRADQRRDLDWMFRLADTFDPAGVLASPLFPGYRTGTARERSEGE